MYIYRVIRYLLDGVKMTHCTFLNPELLLLLVMSQVKSSHLYLYSAFNNTNCNKALHNIKIGKFVNNVKWQDLTLSYLLNAFHYWI